MTDATTTAAPRPVAPADQAASDDVWIADPLEASVPDAVPDNLRVANWLDTSNPELDLELDDVETVEDVRQAFHDVYLADSDSRFWSPAIFAAADGRVYAVTIGVVVRPATPEEIRAAVEAEKGLVLNAAKSRAEKLDGYLSAPGT